MSSLIDYGSLGYKVLSPDPSGPGGIELNRLIKLTSDLIASISTTLALKAPLASPTFTGTVTAPTLNITTAVNNHPSDDIVTTDITLMTFGNDPQNAYHSVPFRLIWDHTAGVVRFDNGQFNNILDALVLKVSSVIADSISVGNSVNCATCYITNDLQISEGGTGASDAATARTNLIPTEQLYSQQTFGGF